MSLTILQVAYALAPVGPDAAGGAEQVLGHLDAALVAAGHRSLVLAVEGSSVAGTLLPLPRPPARLDEAARAAAVETQRRAILDALARHTVDLVHVHSMDFHALLPPPGVPVLVTLHLPPSWHDPAHLTPARPGTWLHGVSPSQHAAIPPSPARLAPIPNGVPVAALRARHARRGFHLNLGRVCPEKGVHLALEAAHLADEALLVGGEVFGYAAHERYFADDVSPLLDARRRFLGPVGFARKRRLMTAAASVLIPSLAPETSSLVAMEALACGTPVIAYPSGALPDIVEHGVTGFLVEDAAGMARAMGRVRDLDGGACRAAAEARFSAARMGADYLAAYAALAGRREAATPPAPPGPRRLPPRRC